MKGKVFMLRRLVALWNGNKYVTVCILQPEGGPHVAP